MKALRINSAGIDGRTIAVSRIDPPRDPIAFFERLKLSFLQWATELPGGHHSLSVTANTPDRDRLYVDLFDTVCGLWNTDPDLREFSQIRVTITLTNHYLEWIGCTNAVDRFDLLAPLGQMHFVDLEQEGSEREEQLQLAIEAEKAYRRANPILRPAPVPTTIRSQLAHYLRLEYGEDHKDKSSIKAKDLSFDGEFVIDGVPTQFWRYPSSDPQGYNWATVERFEDNCVLGFADEPLPK